MEDPHEAHIRHQKFSGQDTLLMKPFATRDA